MTERRPQLHHVASFASRHIGPTDEEIAGMLETLGVDSLDALIDATIPRDIRMEGDLALAAPLTEANAVASLREVLAANQARRSFIGQGYSNTILPPVIQRNVLENPGWYTQYTPYQAEIAQGRLEALFVFQTMISDLTGLPIANASMLDEATAVAEAIAMAVRVNRRNKSVRFLISDACHPQTIDVVKTRAEPLGIIIEVGPVDPTSLGEDLAGVVVQYPDTNGAVHDLKELADAVHARDGLVVVAADLLSLTLLTPPGEQGADIVVGSAQRFGVPVALGGPHAAFMSTRTEFQRQLPGRIVGQSIDADGNPALRLALQTREQHIRRDKATSNICTAQVLLAIMSAFYGAYHGPGGLRRIATRVRDLTETLRANLTAIGHQCTPGPLFDTIKVDLDPATAERVSRAEDKLAMNFRRYADGGIGISLDETTTLDDVREIFGAFGGETLDEAPELPELPAALSRQTPYLTHPVFNEHHSETEFLRWVTRLQTRDLSLATAMIPLGSCTMKLNATSEMLPVTWDTVGQPHPFAPKEQWRGYLELFSKLEAQLSEITGMAATSLQPNAGSQGEYAGLLVIREFHASNGQAHRNICLIPESAHGTNPASAVMAGLKVVAVKCDDHGNIDVDDLRRLSELHAPNLAALMVTYPSTHGVFEHKIREICGIVHDAGGQVYLDGANMNAQVGLCRPGDYGADVCHLNLHKTFCIPHGGGGPGVGPICVRPHLARFLPGHGVVPGVGGETAVGPVSAAPWGSPSILPIPYLYIAMLGTSGLKKASQVAILNANYMAKRLADHFPILYTGRGGRVAHEFILDLRELKRTAGVEVVDVAKRLMDYGFHAPTISWPVPGTMMVEPTESESLRELDRFCDAMIAIRQEIAEIEAGNWPQDDNPLKNAPHTAERVTADEWSHPYSRRVAAFPTQHVRDHKFWPSVSRVDDVHGDRNLVCACPPMSDYAD